MSRCKIGLMIRTCIIKRKNLNNIFKKEINEINGEVSKIRRKERKEKGRNEIPL